MKMMYLNPCVFVTHKEYQIVIVSNKKALLRIKVAGNEYCDEVNGVLLSETFVHKVSIPQELLDREKHYTVQLTEMKKRLAYYTETGETEEYEYDFNPISYEKELRAYFFADMHGLIKEPVIAAKNACNGKEYDMLIFAGDISESCEEPDTFLTLHKIASEVGKGKIPLIFARGNHDTRGKAACCLGQYVATDGGNSYYTFRLGPVWGIVLDCGEDKDDKLPVYNGTADFHNFRMKETEFLRNVADSKHMEYEDDDIQYRIAICHIPFTVPLERENPVFGIEKEIYREWTQTLNKIGVNMMICGHTHSMELIMPGGEQDAYGQKFPTVIASELQYAEGKPELYGGASMEFDKDHITINCSYSYDKNIKQIFSEEIN